MSTAENMMLVDATSQDDTQAQAIGTVVTVYGTAGVRTPSGDLTVLEAGDPVFQNDRIETGEPGGLVVEFTDGSRLDLGRNSHAMLDEEVYDATLAQDAPEDVRAESSEIDQVFEELNLDELAPTAASANANNEDNGNSFVILDRSDQSTDPEAAALDTDFLEQVFGSQPVEDSVPPALANGLLDAPPVISCDIEDQCPDV